MIWLRTLRERARRIKRETYVLYLACRDRRTPWYAKALAGVVVAYALSPIDLIPDFVPLLGYLDDVILLPLGIVAVMKLVPEVVLVDCRARAEAAPARPTNRTAAAVIVAIWVVVAGVLLWLTLKVLT